MRYLLLAFMLLWSYSAMADYVVRDGNGNMVTIHSQNNAGVNTTNSVPSNASGVPYDTGNPLPVTNPSLNISPGSCVLYTVTTGGTAVAAIVGPIKGGFIVNPVSAAAEGISAVENLYIDMVGVPGSTDAVGNNSTAILVPGQPFYLPALINGISVRLNAATSGHKFTCEKW